MQRFVTIYLDSATYAGDRWLVASHAEKHGIVEDQLKSELAEGWRIVSVCGFGGAPESTNVRGWLAVVLEK